MTDELKQWEYDKGYTKGYSDGRASLIKELEKIKSEIKDLLFSYGYLDMHTNNDVLEIIENHISKFKEQ